MLVTTGHGKYRFNTPHRNKAGGSVSGGNYLVGKYSAAISGRTHEIDFTNVLYHDKSEYVLAKKNISGNRR